MNKYVGKYRVDIERCPKTGDVIEEADTFLRCLGRNKGGKVYRYDEEILVCYVASSLSKAKNMVKDINNLGVEIVKLVEYNNEGDIYFYEKDLDKIVDVICITTNGAKIHPRSIKNHPRRDEIRQEKLDKLSDEEKLIRKQRGEMLREYRNANKN